MSIKTAAITYLLADAGVSAAVGTRIAEDVVRTDWAFPRLTVTWISRVHESHMGAAAGLAMARLQVDSWADTAADRETTGEAVREALDGLRGTTWGDESIRAVDMDGESDTFEPGTDGSEEGAWRTRQDYIIWYAETVPTWS